MKAEPDNTHEATQDDFRSDEGMLILGMSYWEYFIYPFDCWERWITFKGMDLKMFKEKIELGQIYIDD